MYKQIILTLCVYLTSVNAQYDIRGLPGDTRNALCNKNTAFCLNACLQKVATNTCSPSTMVWSCQCASGAPPVSNSFFPIQAQQCIGENGECRAACVKTGGGQQAVSTCSYNCDQKFVCGTAKSGETKNFTSGATLPPFVVIVGNQTSSIPITTSTMTSANATSIVASTTVTSTRNAPASTTLPAGDNGDYLTASALHLGSFGGVGVYMFGLASVFFFML